MQLKGRGCQDSVDKRAEPGPVTIPSEKIRGCGAIVRLFQGRFRGLIYSMR